MHPEEQLIAIVVKETMQRILYGPTFDKYLLYREITDKFNGIVASHIQGMIFAEKNVMNRAWLAGLVIPYSAVTKKTANIEKNTNNFSDLVMIATWK
jgi:hypothetical protein